MQRDFLEITQVGAARSDLKLGPTPLPLAENIGLQDALSDPCWISAPMQASCRYTSPE